MTVILTKQLQYMLNKHPFDKNILNFVLLRDHDASSKVKCGQDLKEVLNVRRPDLLPLGYKYGVINVKNDKIAVSHYMKNIDSIKSKNINFTLKGHSHSSKFDIYSSHNILSLPTLSQLSTNGIPSAFGITLYLNYGLFWTENFKQLMVGSEIYEVINLQFGDLGKGKKIYSNIKNEEERKKILIK